MITPTIAPPLPASLPVHSPTTPVSHQSGASFAAKPDGAAAPHLLAQQASKVQEPLPDHVNSFYTRGVAPNQGPLLASMISAAPDSSSLNASLNTGFFSEEVSFFERKKKKNSSTLNSAELLEVQAELTEVTLEYGFYGQLASKAAGSIQALFNNQV